MGRYKYMCMHNIYCLSPGTTIKATVMSVLLCLLSALVEVHSQTVPFVSFMGTSLTNHSYMNITLVGNNRDGYDSVQCHSDLDTCCGGSGTSLMERD